VKNLKSKLSPVVTNAWWSSVIVLCSPVYPAEEADDENVVDDSGATELTLDKIEDDTVLVILLVMLVMFSNAVIVWFKCH